MFIFQYLKLVDRLNKNSLALPDKGDAQYLLEVHTQYDHLV